MPLERHDKTSLINVSLTAEQECFTGIITGGWRWAVAPLVMSTESSHQGIEGGHRKEGTEIHKDSKYIPWLSRLCIYKLHLNICRHASSIASFWLHLVLNWAHRIHSTKEVSWTYMSCVNKVCWLTNHTSINSPPSFRLRLFGNTAVETQPEFTHVGLQFKVQTPRSGARIMLQNCAVVIPPGT